MKYLTYDDIALLVDALKNRGIYVSDLTTEQHDYSETTTVINITYITEKNNFLKANFTHFSLFPEDLQERTDYDLEAKILEDMPLNIKIVIRLAYIIYLIETFYNKNILTEEVAQICKQARLQKRDLNIIPFV